MKTLCFVVPAHGRQELTAICLRQLRRTCSLLGANGIEAWAVVIACDENLDTARNLSFDTIERDNSQLGRRFNDGIQSVCDPDFTPIPVDYVVPFGSDDWIDYGILLDLPGYDSMRGFKMLAVVREDGRELRESIWGFTAGCGIRVYPSQVMERVGFRPADDRRMSGCDLSTLINIRKKGPLKVTYGDTHPLQIVDWKSSTEQIHGYASLAGKGRVVHDDPIATLRGVYPDEALDEIAAYHQELAREPVTRQPRSREAPLSLGGR